ncbi:DNA phosphorothioation-associated putative methyltransferase [Caballeronia sp. Sq4a]|uniref:DNA phosphorothioation-associated putative methyltransferase n=1 Tax=Caballeronia sp. Sq4a TaxID=2878152 RepID=UPI0020BFBEDD|nr:DNA phosphorothioation-associated putative methyltransferase [Caballeronia sp. Sq4a]
MTVGKRVHDELYIHLSALESLQDDAQKLAIAKAAEIVGRSGELTPNVAKINLRTGSFSLLSYPQFDEEPFPTLMASWRFAAGTSSQPIFRSYIDSLNPPILHRKEKLVLDTDERRHDWMHVTSAAEQLGLFDDPLTIGFRENWTRLIAAKGYQLIGSEFIPLANEVPTEPIAASASSQTVNRHLTALNRNVLSAPVQLLFRHELLSPAADFFDYGCGRGDDLAGLRSLGFEANGWDPHYAPTADLRRADVVNLGFVINVVEDAAERVEALRGAFRLARRVLSIGVMLHTGDISGRPYRDGVLTSRNTFQKYFTQAELKDFIEAVLHREAFMVAPGIAFIFADNEAEQSFVAGRYRRRNVAERLLSAQAAKARMYGRATKRATKDHRAPDVPRTRITKVEQQRAAMQPHLQQLWITSLDLGREPDPSEVSDLNELLGATGTFARALRFMKETFDPDLLHIAASHRTDDLRLYFAIQHFEKRQKYRSLEARIQRDIKSFFGDYASAQAAGVQLLREAADPTLILSACKEAQANGLGWLDGEHSLQLHVSLTHRLPVILRAYVACAMVVCGSMSDVQLVKIHVTSGKLTLLEFDDFETSPIPLLKRRLKINIRKQSYEVYEYGSRDYPKPFLFRKSRFLNEDCAGYAEQLEFDEALEQTGLLNNISASPSTQQVEAALEERRLEIRGMRLARSTSIPDLDQACGQHFTFRDFVECGETQKRLNVTNVPRSPATYNAFYDLATQVLDPIIEYFGSIRLTYGFCSPDLSKHITRRVAPKLDQHSSCELSFKGSLICPRGGAACDFIIDDENMADVVDWIIDNVGFDRIYYYGEDRPIHISWAPEYAADVYSMRLSPSGRLIPRRYGRSQSA